MIQARYCRKIELGLGLLLGIRAQNLKPLVLGDHYLYCGSLFDRSFNFSLAAYSQRETMKLLAFQYL